VAPARFSCFIDIFQRILVWREERTKKFLVFLYVEFERLFALRAQLELTVLGQDYSLELLDRFIRSDDLYLSQFHSSTQVNQCYFGVVEESAGWDSNMTTNMHSPVVIGGGSENTLEGKHCYQGGREVLNMTQTNAIILRFRDEEVGNFEALFRKEVLPLWRQFKARGKIIAASLTPVQDGNRRRKGVRDYILHVEVPSMAEHSEFDSNASFLKFLPKAQAMQPEEPLVWLGNTLFQV